ncbi:alpha/beta fold hydrolase [Methyloligella solikamskensis]|uniref:Alpha/beta fold hydrolase n=1 Tax=Methyloligella solikamskensis TaxID=1177756 RepID=A0ABW3JD94_9HYPH
MTFHRIHERAAASLFCFLAIALLAVVSGSTAFAASLEGWSHKMIDKGDVHLEIFERGEGQTVLMHPSLGRPAQDFEALGNSVAEAGYHVVLINPRGIGESTGPMETVKLQDLGNDVWMVADQLGLDKVFMLGQNFGNRVSRTVSSLQPDRVIGLMLLAAGGEIQPSKATWAEFEKMYDPSLSPEEHREAVMKSMFAPGNSPDAFLGGWNQKTAELQAEAAKRTDFKPLFNGGTAPALVVQGLQDKIAPPQNAFDFVTNRPNARLVAFPNMGHAMLPEQPDHIADAVINFLNDQK